jgi:hypothetical protein
MRTHAGTFCTNQAPARASNETNGTQRAITVITITQLPTMPRLCRSAITRQRFSSAPGRKRQKPTGRPKKPYHDWRWCVTGSLVPL